MAIRAEQLEKSYKKRKVVNGVALTVERGEIVGLLGPNGAGKTTTFYMIVGLIKAQRGHVYLDDAEVTNVPMHKRARMGIGYLAQEASIFRRLSVLENLLLVLELAGVTGKAARERAEKLLGEFGLDNVAKQMGYSLSGGERRRVEIARALATEPSFVLLDEPFTGVDPIAISDLQKIIVQLKDRGIGVLITDHSVREMFKSLDRGYIMYDGKIMAQGAPDVIRTDPLAREFYLGRDFEL